MTTPYLKEIKDAIANLKKKRLEIINLEDNLEQLQFQFDELYEAFLNDPAHAEIVEIAAEIALLNDIGGNEYNLNVEQFPVDEPVENWEAKEPTPESEKTFNELLTAAVNEAEKTWPYRNTTDAPTDPTPDVSNEPQDASAGDAGADSDDDKPTKKP